MPERTGELVIPPGEWPFFNPRTGRYEVALSPELRVEVVPAGAAPARAGPGANPLAAGLRPIRAQASLSRRRPPAWERAEFYLLLLLPPLGFAATMLLGRLRARSERTGGLLGPGRTARRGLRAARRRLIRGDPPGFVAEVERALFGYASDRLGRPAVGLTRDALLLELSRAGAHPPAVRALVRALDAVEVARYAAGDPGGEDLLEVAERAVRVLEEADWQPGKEAEPCDRGALGTHPGFGRAFSTERFETANRAYLAGNMTEAARGYQELFADGWESAALHVNLGNARYRMGQRGLAVASYRRALRLDPGDSDAKANLELARKENVDQVLGAEARPLALRAVDRVPDAVALGLFVLAWVALWGGLALRRFALGALQGGLGALAFASAVLVVLSGGLLAGKAPLTSPDGRGDRQGERGAGRPGATLSPTFELHEGTEVRVLEVRGGAVRVRLGNGLEGWILAADIEPI